MMSTVFGRKAKRVTWHKRVAPAVAFLATSTSLGAQTANDSAADQLSGPKLIRRANLQSQTALAPDSLCDSTQAGVGSESGECDSNPGSTAFPSLDQRGSVPMPGLRSTDERSQTTRRGFQDPAFPKTIEKPTEFQIFVKRSVGEELPIYGASLFDQVPSTFAPVDRIPVSSDYTVGPGDEIDIRVWGQINSTQKLIVDRSGDLFIPQVGRVNVSGLHFVDIEPAIRTSIGRVFRNFELSVNMGQLRSVQVFVMGQACRPGTYTVSSLSTLVNALFVSGGPSSRGSMRNIQLKRSGRVVTNFDLYDLLLHGDKTKDVSLQPGDVIFIPPVGAHVAVSGSVGTAAIYEVLPNTPLGQVLAYAGGLSPVAGGQHAVLERIDRRAALQSENVELNESGLDRPLQDGDIVRLPQVVARFAKTVALKGNVADPVRLPWRAGMRISDVIPEKGALLTRNYWEEHNRLTAGSASFKDEKHDDRADTSLASAILDSDNSGTRKFNAKNEVQPPAPDINWSYAAIERLDAQHLTTRLIPFNLGKVVLEHDPVADLPLEPGDVITVFSKADFMTPQAEQTRFVRLEGEVRMAGVYSVQPGETLRQLVARAGGLTDRAYLYGAEFTRESTRREQQKRYSEYLDQMQRDIEQSASALGMRSVNAASDAMVRASLEVQRKALDRLRQTQPTGRIVLDLTPTSKGLEAIPDLPLDNGDRLTVPSVPVTVNVFGTVYNQSTFLYKEDLGVRDYLHQAGGATRFADPSHMFVLRADGSVVSRSNYGHFEKLTIHAGDSLIVPSNVMKTSAVRNLMDWSQVVSGFGIGAAAVNVLR
jgi:polysaccharide biosynthesis/export protein